MIAIALFLTSFCMIIGIFPVTFKSVQLSKESLIASNIAEQQLEYAKSLTFGEISNDPNGPLKHSSYVLSNTVNGVQQSLEFSVDYFVTSISTELKDVKVTVTWYKGANNTEPHYVVLETKIAKLY